MNIFDKVKKLIEDGKTDEANAALAEHMANEVKGLKDKNNELIEKLKGSKEDVSKLTERLDKMDEEQSKLLEQKLAKSGDFDKLRTQLEERHAKELKLKDDLIAERDKTIGEKEGTLKKYIVGEGLTTALTKAKVKPEMMAAVKAMIESQYEGEIGDNDGKPFAKFNGKAVDEFVTSWAQSDDGKPFISAGGNTGGGSQGANGTGKAADQGVKTIERSDFDALSQAERMTAAKEGYKVVEST